MPCTKRLVGVASTIKWTAAGDRASVASFFIVYESYTTIYFLLSQILILLSYRVLCPPCLGRGNSFHDILLSSRGVHVGVQRR